MGTPEGANDNKDTSDQIDFFTTLDAVVPNEDYKERALDTFGTTLCFDPKTPTEFEITNATAQMTATVIFTKQGVITDVSVSRWHSEAGEIEKNWVARFKADAAKAIAEHAGLLGVEPQPR